MTQFSRKDKDNNGSCYRANYSIWWVIGSFLFGSAVTTMYYENSNLGPMLGSGSGFAVGGSSENDSNIMLCDTPILKDYLGGSSDPNGVTSKVANTLDGPSDWCQEYLGDMEELPYRSHRKQWEFCFVAHGLDHYKKLKANKYGLGFHVGREPLASYFVKRGAKVTVSGINPDDGGNNDELLNTHVGKVISAEKFIANSVYTSIPDIHNLPEALLQGEYDFVWSSSLIEHLGSVDNGYKFVLATLKALKIGGIAIHTSEFAISTMDSPEPIEGNMKVWVKDDVEKLKQLVEQDGCCKMLPMDYKLGNRNEDLKIDKKPYQSSNHFKLEADNGMIYTSVGFLFIKER